MGYEMVWVKFELSWISDGMVSRSAYGGCSAVQTVRTKVCRIIVGNVNHLLIQHLISLKGQGCLSARQYLELLPLSVN